MAEKLSPTARRPAGKVSVRLALRIFRPGQRVLTKNGARRAEQLRPGDRLEEGSVLWLAMSRGAEGDRTINVMLGAVGARRAPASPVMGRVSPETGRFERTKQALPPRGVRLSVH